MASAFQILCKRLSYYCLVLACSAMYIFSYFVNLVRLFVNGKRCITKNRASPPSCLVKPELGVHGYLTLKNRNDLKIHYVAKGKPGNPLVLFLHGFPEFWYSWRFQLQDLSDDLYVIAVDMTGYGDSSKPQNLDRYHVNEIAEDMKEVILELGYNSCILVGHDWGGVVSFSVAHNFPEVVNKLVVVNVPHSRSFKKASFKQLWCFTYIYFFQLPFIPEWILSSNDFSLLNYIKSMANSNNFTASDLEAYKYCFQKGGFTFPLNYYRNLYNQVYTSRGPFKKIVPPTLLIWGVNDPICLLESGRLSLEALENGKIECIENASHAPHYDQPKVFNSTLMKFISS